MVYRKRIFTEIDKERLLVSLRECREACTHAHTAAPINGEVYRAVSTFQTALDDLTGVLTGDRTHFHLKSHSTHGAPRQGG